MLLISPIIGISSWSSTACLYSRQDIKVLDMGTTTWVKIWVGFQTHSTVVNGFYTASQKNSSGVNAGTIQYLLCCSMHLTQKRRWGCTLIKPGDNSKQRYTRDIQKDLSCRKGMVSAENCSLYIETHGYSSLRSIDQFN